MDLLALLTEHSRASAERVARAVGEDPDRFAELVHLMLDGSRPRTSQLAAHAVAVVCDERPQLATPHVKDLLAALDRPLHEGVHRTCVRTLQHCALPARLHGAITQRMFACVADPARPIAQRAFAIRVAQRMVEAHPELGPELRLILEDVLREHPGPAVRSRASKVLRALA